MLTPEIVASSARGLLVGHRAVEVPGSAPVLVWWASTLPDQVDPGLLRADVDDRTAARADRMARPEDRLRVLVAHALLRRVVAPLLGVAPAEVDLRRRCDGCGSDDHGRPYLHRPDNGRPHLQRCGPTPSGSRVPDVSISHAGELAVVALAAPGLRVGVDVEAPRPGGAWRQAYASVMSPAEREAAAACADPDAACLRAWTGKEAVAKATGLGLADDLTAVEVLAPVRRRGGRDDDGRGWRPVPRHGAAVTFLVLRPPGRPDAMAHQGALALIRSAGGGSGLAPGVSTKS